MRLAPSVTTNIDNAGPELHIRSAAVAKNIGEELNDHNS